MKEKQTWVIIDTRKNTVLHGIRNKTLAFTTSEIAHQVAAYFFEERDHYLIVEIPALP